MWNEGIEEEDGHWTESVLELGHMEIMLRDFEPVRYKKDQDEH